MSMWKKDSFFIFGKKILSQNSFGFATWQAMLVIIASSDCRSCLLGATLGPQPKCRSSIPASAGRTIQKTGLSRCLITQVSPLASVLDAHGPYFCFCLFHLNLHLRYHVEFTMMGRLQRIKSGLQESQHNMLAPSKRTKLQVYCSTQERSVHEQPQRTVVRETPRSWHQAVYFCL